MATGAAMFHRWDRALKQCMDAKKKGGTAAEHCRWRGDPLQLNQEAHELPPEKQREALDMLAEASAELRGKLAPIWKYCFAQWHVYDIGLEFVGKGKPLSDAFADELFLKDVESLRKLGQSGELEQAKTTERWTWTLLDATPATAVGGEEWSEAAGEPLLKDGRRWRREGVSAFREGSFPEAFFRFNQGLRALARAPPTVRGPHASLRADLYKNSASAALRLGMNRTALRLAHFAILIDGQDPKAWYRKATALEALGKQVEASTAFAQAGVPQRGSAAASAASGPGALASLPAGGGLGGASPGPGGVLGRAAVLLGGSSEDEETLPLRLHARLEQIAFVEVGIDSIAAIDMIRHVQAEIRGVSIPLTLVFDCPLVAEASSLLLEKLNVGDEPLTRARVNNTMWRSMCRTLGTDPVQGLLDGRLGACRSAPSLSEAEAAEVLNELFAAYNEESFARRARDLARRANFEQRPFLLSLRPLALEVQKPILEARGLDPDLDGLRALETGLLAAVARAPSKLAPLLRQVRETQQGGPNGMWAVNMETNEVEEVYDCNSLQSWSTYMKADPFPERKNTNSVLAAAAA